MQRSILYSLFFCCLLSTAYAQDTLVPASRRYQHPGLLQRLFIGGNYRATWSQPSSLKIFRIDTAMGGFAVKKMGGGMQTQSLRIVAANGDRYVLRTIDKKVGKALASVGVHNDFAHAAVQDMISAADPYAAVTVPPMARALGIISLDDEAVFVADNAGLDTFRAIFANTVCLLERQYPLVYEDDETENTKQMLKDIADSPAAYHLDEKMLLQARLLDMLLGDWDRHSDQWKWEYHQAGGITAIYPVPHDHDQAYFQSNGLLIHLVRPFAMKHMVAFRARRLRLKKLNRKEWSFDKVLLANLTEQHWQDGLRTFCTQLTNDVLATAVKRLPPEIYAKRGASLLKLLESRRDAMPAAVMRYRKFLLGFKAGSVLRKAKEDDD